MSSAALAEEDFQRYKQLFFSGSRLYISKKNLSSVSASPSYLWGMGKCPLLLREIGLNLFVIRLPTSGSRSLRYLGVPGLFVIRLGTSVSGVARTGIEYLWMRWSQKADGGGK